MFIHFDKSTEIDDIKIRCFDIPQGLIEPFGIQVQQEGFMDIQWKDCW